MGVVNSGYPSDVHGLVTIHLWDNTQELTIVDIGTILGLAHLLRKLTRASLSTVGLIYGRLTRSIKLPQERSIKLKQERAGPVSFNINVYINFWSHVPLVQTYFSPCLSCSYHVTKTQVY